MKRILCTSIVWTIRIIVYGAGLTALFLILWHSIYPYTKAERDRRAEDTAKRLRQIEINQRRRHPF